ncbi:MAG TPA: membrane dipeptidase [Sphingobium sp.]
MMTQANHHDMTVIDGLIVCNWSRSIFEEMVAGGLTAANCTCSIWEGFGESMQQLAALKQLMRDNADLVTPVYGVTDIDRARSEGKVGIILGWQNSTGFGEDLRMVPLYAELGLRVVQMTYHTANFAGSGCLEGVDRGLTDFGRDLVAALNEEGILIDLSHVGAQTAMDVVLCSQKPVAYTHCAPRALKEHARNKADEELLAVTRRGGVIGVTMFPPFMPRGNDSSLEDYVDVVDYVVSLCGEDHVAIGTDFMLDFPQERVGQFLQDKGVGRKLLNPTKPKFPDELQRISQFPNLTDAMQRRGWKDAKIEKVIGGNWQSLFAQVWR